MNLPLNKPSHGGSGNAGAVGIGVPGAAPAQSLTVGSVQFRNTQLPAELADEVMEQMADSIVDLTHQLEEANAREAVLEQQAVILIEERDEARVQYRTTELLGMALAKTINEMKEERADLKAEIESLRDQLCADKCREKAAADGNWVNC